MTRFILLSFAFLGWAYYEVSGGADFEPGRYLDNDMHAAAALTAQSDTAAAASVPVVSRAAQGGAELIRLAGDPAAASDRADPEPMVQFVSLSPAPAQLDQARQGAARISDVLLTRREAVAVPAPEAGGPVAPAPEAAPDMRRVAGSRVNLRNGPGTRHSVVAKLDRGTAVEVLRAEGGWLKLRVAENKRIGWMADYLVTAASE